MEFRIHNVSPEFIGAMRELDFPGLNAETLVEMRIHNVTVEQARRAKEVYGDELTAEELVEMAAEGTLRKLLRAKKAQPEA